MSQELNSEQIKDIFINEIWNDIERINKSEKSDKEKLESLAFSILSVIDGSRINIPGFILAPIPHEENKDFCKKMDINYFPENHLIRSQIQANISGSLHEDFYSNKKKNLENLNYKFIK